jgi:hypothetical protein
MKTAPFFCRGAHVGRPLTQIIQFTSISHIPTNSVLQALKRKEPCMMAKAFVQRPFFSSQLLVLNF